MEFITMVFGSVSASDGRLSGIPVTQITKAS
jgi:hypothetical protein